MKKLSSGFRVRADHIQEQLIREGNAMTLNELKSLKDDRDSKKKELQEAKGELKKVIDIIPLVIAGPNLKKLTKQLEKELKLKQKHLDKNLLKKRIGCFLK